MNNATNDSHDSEDMFFSVEGGMTPGRDIHKALAGEEK